MINDLELIKTAMSDGSWLDRQQPGGGYHRAEFVGRQFTEASHGLRKFYDASILATTTAGGYEDEEA